MSVRTRLFPRIRTLALACLLPALPSLAADVVEVQVRHEGGAIDPAAVLSFTDIRPGQPFSARVCADDVRVLQKTGRFVYVGSEVEQVAGGVSVTYVVQSKPRIRRIKVDGAGHFTNARVKELLELEVGQLIDKPALESRLSAVREEYRKDYYPDTTLTYTWTPADEGRTVDLEFKVDEGLKSRVSDIVFSGKDLPPGISGRQLRKPMLQKQANLFSWITGTGALDKVALDGDRTAVRDVLRRRGYLDATVGEAVITRSGPKSVKVTLPVEAGPEYRVRDIAIEGVRTFPLDPLLRLIRVERAKPANTDQLDRSRAAIRDFYGERGYIDAAVSQRVVPIPGQPGVVDIVYVVEENRQAFIRNIQIRGNTRTKDKVIRRELTVLPGEVYDEVSVRKSAARLRNLNYFAIVNAQPRETGEPGRYDVVVDVEEQSTGQFLTGAGFSSIDDLIGFVEVSQGNFNLGGFPDNLTGGGQKIKLGLQLGTKRRDVQFSFVEPWFLDRKLSLGFDLYQNDRRFLSDDYDQRSTGGALSLSRALGTFWRGRAGYSLEHIDVYDVADDASEIILQEEGSSMESAVTLSATRDTRDAVLVPTRGNYLKLSYKIAGGPLGFDTDFLNPEVSGSQYLPLFFGHVLSLKGSAETVQTWAGADRVRLFDRLFMGGARNVRAFKYRKVGPKDEFGEPIGGQTSLFGSIEYTIPLVDKFRFAAFYDWGMVDPEEFSVDMDAYNSGYGLGIRIDMPGFPMQLDYAWPDKADEFNDDRNGRFNFFIGYPLY